MITGNSQRERSKRLFEEEKGAGNCNASSKRTSASSSNLGGKQDLLDLANDLLRDLLHLHHHQLHRLDRQIQPELLNPTLLHRGYYDHKVSGVGISPVALSRVYSKQSLNQQEAEDLCRGERLNPVGTGPFESV